MITQKEYKTLKKMCNDYEKEQRINAIKEKFEFIDFLNIFEYEIKNKNNINLIIGNDKLVKLTMNEILTKYLYIYENLETFYIELVDVLNSNSILYGYENEHPYLHMYNKIKPYIEYNEEQARLHWEQIDDDYKDLPIDPT